MKRMIPLMLLAALSLVACEKEPDSGELDYKFLVYTDHDTGHDFNAARTYYLPDSILLIGNYPTAQYWKDDRAQRLIDTYADNMETLGYTRTDKREDADMGLQVSYVENTYHTLVTGSPEWWWNYSGYWNLGYWGNWGYWYYPYVVHYSFSTGAFIAEMLDLKAPQGEDEQLPVVWSSYLTGQLSGVQAFDLQQAIEGVNQSFAQSAYLAH